MKKLSFAIMLITVLIASLAVQNIYAASLDVSKVLEQLPETNQGVVYSAIDSEFKYSITAEVASYPKENPKFHAELGAVIQDNEVIGALTYNIADLENYNIELPIIDSLNFNIGFYTGLKDIFETNEFDCGGILSIKAKF